MVEHIDDIREEYRKKLLPFIKFYDKLANRELQQFMNRPEDIQVDIYNLVLTNNSLLEEILRNMMEEELNGSNSSTTE